VALLDSTYCAVAFATTRDRLTVVPDGSGDTFASLGITIRVFVKDCNGAPLVGVPRHQIVIYTPASASARVGTSPMRRPTRTA
jgi:hypothetical protein